MIWSKGMRQVHRWLSLVFTGSVIVTFVALQLKGAPAWMTYLPLPPLFLLLFTGLYLFVLPYVGKRRTGQGSGT